MPEERQKSFPKANVESTDRHDWLEKMENAQDTFENTLHSCEQDNDDFILVTSVQPMTGKCQFKSAVKKLCEIFTNKMAVIVLLTIFQMVLCSEAAPVRRKANRFECEVRI